MKIEELNEKRLRLVNEMQEVHDQAENENRGLNAEEQTKFDKMNKDYDDLKRRIDTQTALEKRKEEMAAPVGDTGLIEDRSDKKEERQEEYRAAFGAYLRNGIVDMDTEQRAILRSGFQNEKESRAAQTETTTGGGYLIPQGFSNKLEEAMLWYGPMLRVATIQETSKGNALPWPTYNDTNNKGSILAINTQASQTPVGYGQVIFNAYKYSSDIVLVPNELLQDSAFNLTTHITNVVGERIGRIINEHMTTGTGTNQPNGIVTAATSGKVGATGQTTSIIYDDIIDTKHSVDIAYRKMPGSAFMCHDLTIGELRKLKSTTGYPLWQPSLTASEPDRLDGSPIYANNDMATMAASAKSLIFGNIKKYMIRRVRNVTVRRLTERYADYDQTAFLALARYDGDLLDAGTHPVKYYANSAT